MFKRRLIRTPRNGFITKDMCIPDHLDIEVLHVEGQHLYSLTCYNGRDEVVLRLCMSRDCFAEVSDGMRQCMVEMDQRNGVTTPISTDDRMYN